MAKFQDIFTDKTSQGHKLQTSEYLKSGKYPIIDQGKEQIAGYTNSEDGIFFDVPAIIFGDHTRIIKYVDEPFFLGADGVKVLKCKMPDVDYKYLYYYLQNVHIPNTGYNRHFKWLKEAEFYIHPFDEQRKIAAVLDKISDLIAKRRRQLDKLDELVKSRFVEMFGTIDVNKYKFEVVTLEEASEQITDGTHQTPIYTEDMLNGYKFLSSRDVVSGMIDWENVKYIPEILHKELYSHLAPRKGDILLAKNGTTGIAAVVDCDEVFDIYVSLALIRPKTTIEPVYLWAAINSIETKRQFDANLKGIGVPNLHLKEIRKARVILPPQELQRKFVAFVEKNHSIKLTIQRSLTTLDMLKKSLMQEYFSVR